jgi:hypothetical protein
MVNIGTQANPVRVPTSSCRMPTCGTDADCGSNACQIFGELVNGEDSAITRCGTPIGTVAGEGNCSVDEDCRSGFCIAGGCFSACKSDIDCIFGSCVQIFTDIPDIKTCF